MKYLIFIILFFAVLFSNAQSLDSIAEAFAKQATSEILTKFNQNTEKISLKIKFTALYNQDGKQTQLSNNLGFTIGKYLEKELNNVIIKKFNFTINTSYAITNDDLQTINKFDYTLTGYYEITKNAIIFSKFTFTNILTNKKIILSNYKIKVPNTGNLKKSDNQTLDAYASFMAFKRDNNFADKITLTKPNFGELTPKRIEGIGDVYEIQYDTDYNLNINLNKDAYIYAFFYDPGDNEFPYIWVIDNPNTIYPKGNHNDFLNQNMQFYDNGSGGQFFYIKLFFSDVKIDIGKIYNTMTYYDNEAVVLTRDRCNVFLTEIKNIKNIQTKTLILTLKK